MRRCALVLLCAVGSGFAATEPFTPARYQTGVAPALPALAVGGGQVILELTVDRDGRVAGLTPLRTTPPFTDFVADAVRNWRFAPATRTVKEKTAQGDEREVKTAVDSKVLVAAVFRPPALNTPTLGELPRDTRPASVDVAFPITIAEPPHPPLAFYSGVVVVEARVGGDGYITEETIVGSAPPFDDSVRAALRQWTFLPANVQGYPTATYVYLVFGFPVPVLGPTVRPPGAPR